MHLTVAHILALLAVPGIFLSFWLFPKYVFLSNLRTMERYHAAALEDKTFFIALSMIVIGFLTILEWNALFPDRRDYMIFGPLPVPLRTVFGAKLIALFLFLAVFCVDINFSSIYVFPIVVSEKDHSLTWRWITHATCVFAASAFVFFFFVALQGLLMNILSHRWFRRVSFLVQSLGLFALLSSLLLLPRLPKLLQSMRTPGGVEAEYFPPLWFLGLYETMLGKTDPIYRSLATTALLSLGAVLGATLVAYFISYKRHVKRSLEAVELLAGEPPLLDRYASAILGRWLVKPLERATFFFLWRTLLRSPKHKLFLAAYAGTGFAFVLEGFTALIWARNTSLDQPTPMLLSIPLVLSFFILSGIRIIFTIPAELRANWVFRITENGDIAAALSGVRKAVHVLVFTPVFAVALPFYVFLWGWQIAVIHMLFCLALSLLLLDCLLHTFHKIPFTCSYLPGRANLPALFLCYWLGFTTYAYSMAALELWMMQNPWRLVAFFALILVALIRLRMDWTERLSGDLRLVFEDSPEPVVLTLNLSQ